MAYTPDNLEHLRRSFVADRSSVRWVQAHQLVTVNNVATWRLQLVPTPPTVTSVTTATMVTEMRTA